MKKNSSQQKLSPKTSRSVRQPAAKGRENTNRQARQTRLKDGAVRFEHSEYLGLVDLESVFNPHKYPINPGLKSTFPWLSGMAAQYDMYRVEKFCVRTETAVGTSVSGRRGVSIDYDPYDPVPDSEQTLLNSAINTVSGPVWQEEMCMRVPKTRLAKQYHLRSGATGASLQDCDLGNIFVYAEGPSYVAKAVGVWIDYSIILTAPQVSQPDQSKLLSVLYAPAQAIANTFGWLPLLLWKSDLNGTDNPLAIPDAQTLGRITLPRGSYLVEISASCYQPSGTAVKEVDIQLKYDGLPIRGSYRRDNTDGALYTHIFTSGLVIASGDADLVVDIAANGNGVGGLSFQDDSVMHIRAV